MSSSRSRLRGLLDAERAVATAASRLADAATVPEARACLEELRYAAAWVCAGLERRVSRTARRPAATAAASARVVIDRVLAGVAAVDQLRLVNRSQRSVVVRIDGLLAESLDPDLRAFLEEARVIVARSVTGCDATIMVLDRDREVRHGLG